MDRTDEPGDVPPTRDEPGIGAPGPAEPDFLHNLALRALGLDREVHPVLPTRFAPAAPPPDPFWRRALEGSAPGAAPTEADEPGEGGANGGDRPSSGDGPALPGETPS